MVVFERPNELFGIGAAGVREPVRDVEPGHVAEILAPVDRLRAALERFIHVFGICTARVGSPHVAPHRTDEIVDRHADRDVVAAQDTAEQHLLVEPELNGGFGRVLTVRSVVAEHEHVGVRIPRLGQVRRVVSLSERMQVRADFLAAVSEQNLLEPLVRVRAERVVGDEEVPLLAVFEQFGPDGVREHRVGTGLAEGDAVRFRPGDVRVVRPDREEEGVIFFARRRNGQTDCRTQAPGEQVDLLLLDQPFCLGRPGRRFARVVAFEDHVLDA